MPELPDPAVQAMYDTNAGHYDEMVEAEIDGPVYRDVLGRLAQRLQGRTGPVVDTACGAGQMLHRYRRDFDPDRALIGLDLSPEMVRITANKLDSTAVVSVGDMRSPSASDAAGVINYFALHHLPADQAGACLGAWFGALQPGGQLVLATWEGQGLIDYGGESDLQAWQYSSDQVQEWAKDAGFEVNRCQVLPVEDMPMDAVYLEATRPA